MRGLSSRTDEFANLDVAHRRILAWNCSCVSSGKVEHVSKGLQKIQAAGRCEFDNLSPRNSVFISAHVQVLDRRPAALWLIENAFTESGAPSYQ